MAKKITITELVIKMSMDTKQAAKALQGYESKLKKTQQRVKREDERAAQSEALRLRNAKAFLAGSREYHRLRRRSNQDATKAEKELTKAYMKNDKIQMASIKRQIGERLQEYKLQDKQETDLQRKKIKSRRAIQQMDDRSRKVAIRERKAQEIESKRQARREEHASRLRMQQKHNFLKYMGANSGSIPSAFFGTAAAGMGIGAFAATESSRSLLDYRRAENAAKAALAGSGSTSDPTMITEMVQRNADYFNINRAQHLKAFAQTRAAVSAGKISDQQAMFGLQGLSAASMVTGATSAELERAQVGLLQILTSGIQGQEVKQITENLTGAAPAVWQAIAEISGKKVEGYGDVRKMAESGELAGIKGEEFFKVFTRILNQMFVKAAEKQKGTFPFEQARASQRLDNAKLLFSSGFETQIISTLQAFSTFVDNNEGTIKKLGENLGALASKMIEVGKEIYIRLQPLLDGIYNFIMNTPASELAQIALNVGSIILALKGLSIAASIASDLMFLGKALKGLSGILGLGTSATAAGGAAAAGGAGMGARLLSMVRGAGPWALGGLAIAALADSPEAKQNLANNKFAQAQRTTGPQPTYMGNSSAYAAMAQAQMVDQSKHITVHGDVTSTFMSDMESRGYSLFVGKQ